MRRADSAATATTWSPGSAATAITPGTEALLPGWDGDRLDLGYAVDVMFDFTAPPDDPQPPFASTG